MDETPPTSWHALGRDLFAASPKSADQAKSPGDGRRTPRIMGIVNVTPDSFSDGGIAFQQDAAYHHAMQLIASGADFLDIGGESSRPGAAPVSLDEELRRVIPLIERLTGNPDAPRPIPISVDTTKPEVARRALAAGAHIVNDISGLADPQLRAVVAETGAAVVLMHMRGTPATMQSQADYQDVVAEVCDFFTERRDLALRAGISPSQLCYDPGIGFGKRLHHNLALLRAIPQLRGLGRPLLLGVSRKSFLGLITGLGVNDRLVPSVVSALAAADAGADLVRVHDVAATRAAFAVWEAQVGWSKMQDS